MRSAFYEGTGASHEVLRYPRCQRPFQVPPRCGALWREHSLVRTFASSSARAALLKPSVPPML